MEWMYNAPFMRDKRMDVEKEESTEREDVIKERGEMTNGEVEEEKNSKAMGDDAVSAGLSDDTHKRLTISSGSSSSVSSRRVRSWPKLLSTKSFPLYSQPIGEQRESEWETETTWSPPEEEQQGQLHSEPHVTDRRPHLDPLQRGSSGGEERVGAESSDKGQVEKERPGNGRRDDVGTSTKTARDELRAKWRAIKRGRLGDSEVSQLEGWERKRRRERWSGRRRRAGKAEGAIEEDDMREGTEEREREEKGGRDTDNERKYSTDSGISRSVTSAEEDKKVGDEEKKSSSISETEGESEGKSERNESGESSRGEMARKSSTNQKSSPHSILSRLMHSSTSSDLSVESDEIFSEGEEAATKMKMLRKCRSWRTFLTMMHWSLGQHSSWVQLAGHQGNFQLSEGGEVLKLYSEEEATCLDRLMTDPLRPFVPQYYGTVTRGGHCYIRLEDLLAGLSRPVIMDCKMGVRTYQVEEMAKAHTKPTLRSDMYQKMVKTDPTAPSAEEHAQKGVTKWRYLQWRDASSSTSTMGFRIEGILMEGGRVRRDFKKTLTPALITDALLSFTKRQPHILKAYHSRLQALRDALKESPFFRTHEVIGSSLLFVHDHSSKASVWMIDFGKTTPVPDAVELQHDIPWAEGSREDGYLTGLACLTSSLGQAITLASWRQGESPGGKKTKEGLK